MNNNNLELDEYGMCCPKKAVQPCPEDKSCNKWKKQWEDYLCNEPPEKDPEPYNWCDYDPNEVYFMQYRSKRAFYNEPWFKIFDDTFDDTFE